MITDFEIISVIKKRARSYAGLQIHCVLQRDGSEYWTVRDGTVNAGGFRSLHEAFDAFKETWDFEEERKQN